jgi:aminoglycoside phosphotransferase
VNLVERLLHERYDELHLADAGLSRRFETAVLTPHFVTSRHVVALVFSTGDPRSRVVAKIPRRPGDNEGVDREARMLRRLAELNGGPVAGVPAVVATVDVDGQTLLVETTVHGPELVPRAVREEPDRAVAVGAAFIGALPVVAAAAENADWYRTAVADPLAELVALAPMDGDAVELVDRTHALLEPLRSVALPAVFEHGDMSHPNLLLDTDGGLQVIDWERATERGVPGHDLVFYLQYLAESRRSAYTRPDQCAAFDVAFRAPDGWARPALAAHLELRGVDPALLDLLVVTSWARSAATLVDRLRPGADGVQAAGDALARAVSNDRDVVLWRHAVQWAEEGAGSRA